MRLSRLEINGFKSFAKRTELCFEPGITAIVGPNGCGKSNISDAVRWVLGEQSARALRGQKMEDVIFNGTEQRKALPYCEVTLSFDNSDGQLPIEFSEVSVTRRAYRSGESEYKINKNGCRLKDIANLFRDTGIGKEGYSIIGQGRVDEILSGKSDDRRNTFEEAAGIMRYRVRKEESERKLDNTRKNLLRLEDILRELEAQVGPLEEQSAAARTFLKLRDELKDIEINLFLNQYDKLQERLVNLRSTLEQLSKEIESSSLLEASLNESCLGEEEQERMANSAISEVQNKLIFLSAGVESDSGEAKLLKERMANIRQEQQRLREEAQRALMEGTELEESIQSLSLRKKAEGEELEKARVLLLEAQQQAERMEQEIEDREEELESRKQSIIDAMNRLSDAKSSISRLSAIRDSLEKRLLNIDDEALEIEEEGEKLQREYAEAYRHFSVLEEENKRILEKKNAAMLRQNETNSRLKAAEMAVVGLERNMEAARTRIRVLEEMKKAHEGYYASVRNLMADAERDPMLSQCIEGVVAELLRVPRDYETALEMALGASMQNIVTPTEQDAKRVIEHLRKKQYGRATMLPVSVMRSRLLSAQERDYCKVPGFIGIASDLVGFDERFRGVFENLLGRTVLVEDLDAGIAINKRSHSAFRIATLKGDIINPGGSMTGGSVQKREYSLLGRSREIEELTKKAGLFLLEIRKNQEESQSCEAALREAALLVEEANEEVKSRAVELATQREKLEIIKKYKEENAARKDRFELEKSQIRDSIADIEEQCSRAEATQASIESGNTSTEEDIRKLQESLSRKKEEQRLHNEALTAQKLALLSMEKEADALDKELSRAETAKLRSQEETEKGKRLLLDLEEQVNALQVNFRNVDSQIEAERKNIDALTDQLHSLEAERDSHTAALKEARSRKDELSASLKELQDRYHRAELNENKAQMELNTIQDRVWTDYELSYENALQFKRPIALTAAHLRVDAIKKEMKALGDVNISAIEDYVNVKERYEGLKNQYEDLTKAEADLLALIEDLTGTMEKEFKSQFEKIRENFTSVFTELFGGGKADILLSDKNDVLNCEIEIIAQPPGKKLQLLSLLSGGERALTAIALLFAILKLKPTAFCILDEIETALDEMNVSNFANYLKKYSDKTQFIVITHRKGSMEASDSIYGVTMEEKGVSRIVSARIKEMAG